MSFFVMRKSICDNGDIENNRVLHKYLFEKNHRKKFEKVPEISNVFCSFGVYR